MFPLTRYRTIFLGNWNSFFFFLQKRFYRLIVPTFFRPVSGNTTFIFLAWWNPKHEKYRDFLLWSKPWKTYREVNPQWLKGCPFTESPLSSQCFSCDGIADCPGSYPGDEESCKADGTSLTAIAGSTVLFILLGICTVLLLVVILACYSRRLHHVHTRHTHMQQAILEQGNDLQDHETLSCQKDGQATDYLALPGHDNTQMDTALSSPQTEMYDKFISSDLTCKKTDFNVDVLWKFFHENYEPTFATSQGKGWVRISVCHWGQLNLKVGPSAVSLSDAQNSDFPGGNLY